ncbi:MAG: hypothetical protein KDI56_17705, partial [Xanthomonadales bacterium]|nr:hypothetical protein [Xanthomonadales bacterium]
LIDPRTSAGRALLDSLLANNLNVHAWTFHHDQPGSGWPVADSELSAHLQLPLEAVFCDFPRRALACRAVLG